MHCGHQTLDNAKVLVEHLCKWRQAIRGAGCIGDDQIASLVFRMVHANDVHGHCVLGRCRDNDFFGSTFDVKLCFFLRREYPSRFANIRSTCLAPWDGCWILLVEHSDVATIDNKELLSTFRLTGDCSLEHAMDRVVLQLVKHVVQWHEWVIDSFYLHITVCNGSAENEAADPSKAIDAKS